MNFHRMPAILAAHPAAVAFYKTSMVLNLYNTIMIYNYQNLILKKKETS